MRSRPLRPLVLAILSSVAVAAVLGCGDEGDNRPDPPPVASGVGASCSGDGDCKPGLTCIKELPGGACTARCSGESCPSDSICVRVSIGAVLENLCAPICESQEQCREGYECGSVGRRSVCAIFQ